MQILKLNLPNFKKAVAFLRQGGVVIHPTDTCYGIAADITHQAAVNKVHQLKQTNDQKPMSILVSDLAMLRKYGKLNAKAQALAQKFLPGPLTLIVPKTAVVPDFYAPKTDLIGIRLPDHFYSCLLAQELGNPITTTSANLTGCPPAYSIELIQKYFGDMENLLVLDGGDLPCNAPSTIVEAQNDQLKIIRQGELEIAVSKIVIPAKAGISRRR